MQRLSGLDNLFLQLENSRACMHVAALGIYDPATAPGGKVRFKTVLDFFSSKVYELDFFRRRMVRAPFGLDRPYWIDDRDVDVEYHVRHIALPEPGDWRQLMIQVARIHSRHLDLTRPLWEAYVIEGLDNIEGVAPGSFALYIKMHHAGVDGQAGAEMLQVLHSLTPEYEHAPSSGVVYADREPSELELTLRGLVNQAAKVPDATRLALELGRTGLGLSQKYGGELLDALVGKRDGRARDTGRAVTRFDGKLSPHRVVDALGVEMDDCKRIRAAVDATINDIFLATTAGGVRKYLQAHGELPETSIKAMMPLAATGSERSAKSANNVSMAVLPIATDIEDPLERLRAVRQNAGKGKEVQDAMGRDLVAKLMDVTPALLSKKLTEMAIAGNASITVSNVRGPEIPLYLAGARLQQFMPVSVSIDGIGLNVTGFSYAGTLWICLVACREMVPDPELLTRCLRESFDELLAAACALEQQPGAGKKPAARRKPGAARKKASARAPAAGKAAAARRTAAPKKKKPAARKAATAGKAPLAKKKAAARKKPAGSGR